MVKVAKAAEINYHRANSLVESYEPAIRLEIDEDEEFIDFMTDHISSYLVGLSTHVSGREADLCNYNIKCVLEYERIGDLALNLAQAAQELKEKGLKLSRVAVREMGVLHNALSDILDNTIKAYRDRNPEAAKHIEPVEEVVDELIESLRARHVRRLQTGECNVVAGSTFLDMLTNIERISDQCSNIGVYCMALHDKSIAEDQHGYLARLHKGADPEFNEMYSLERAKYKKMLEIAEEIDN